MSIGIQKIARIAVAGSLIYFLSLLTYNPTEFICQLRNFSFSLSEIGLSTFSILALGGLFYFFFKPQVLGDIWAKIDNELKRKIAKSATWLTKEQQNKLLLTHKGLIRTFFTVIDSNETLKKSADKVRVNGFCLTCFYDLYILSTFFGFINLVGFIKLNYHLNHLYIALVLFITSLISSKFKAHFEAVHIKMGEDQINEIITHHKEEFIKRINEIVVS